MELQFKRFVILVERHCRKSDFEVIQQSATLCFLDYSLKICLLYSRSSLWEYLMSLMQCLYLCEHESRIINGENRGGWFEIYLHSSMVMIGENPIGKRMSNVWLALPFLIFCLTFMVIYDGITLKMPIHINLSINLNILCFLFMVIEDGL